MIYIFLPVHNRREVTLEFVAILNSQTYQNFKLLLIDDGSSDGTAAAVREQIDATVITGSGNCWWGGALDLAYDWGLDNLSKKSIAV